MDKTKVAIKLFDKYAHEYQEKFMDMELYNSSFDLFCESVEKKNATVLDIACGPGNITRYILKKRPHFKILGIDLAPKMIALAKINNPEADFQLMDCRDINSIDKKYDAILCAFCLPYISKEEAIQLIRDAAGLLHTNGIFYLSTMEDDYSKSGFKRPGSGGTDQLFMYYHEAGYLSDALQENGFEIIRLSRQDYPESDGTITTDLIILSKLKKPGHKN